MARYDFKCGSCSHVRELTFSIAEKPPTVSCQCGGEAVSIITGGIEGFIRDRDWNPTIPIVPGRWDQGVTASARRQQVAAQNAALRERAMSAKERGTDKGLRHVASIPAEVYAARVTEDPTYWETDIVSKAKKDGFDLGND